MNTTKNVAGSVMSVAILLGLSGCAGMSTQDKNTAAGAGIGAVAGAAASTRDPAHESRRAGSEEQDHCGACGPDQGR